jgi:hypothetical protein
VRDDGAFRVASAASAGAALELLAAAEAGIRNPAGEVVVIEGFGDEVACDPQRWALVPAALAALEHAHELWWFSGEEAGAQSVEHWPHLLWCTIDGAPAELVIAGTRRIDGRLHLHTWFRYADAAAALRRYWAAGTPVHPVRRVEPIYAERRDVLYLRPKPPLPYRVERLATRSSAFAYLDARRGFPSVIGLELQDVRRGGHDILAAAPPGLLRLPCLAGDAETPQPLRDLLGHALAELA